MYKQIPDYPNYFASKEGTIYRLTKAGVYRPLKPFQRHSYSSYLQVTLRKDGKGYNWMVAHLILITFVGPRPSEHHVARHINDCATDNRLSNLRWGMHSQNMRDKRDNKPRKEQDRIDIMRRVMAAGFTAEDLVVMTKLTPTEIKWMINEENPLLQAGSRSAG